MLDIVHETISKYDMLAPGDGVIVGLSGGADSVVLLAVLLDMGKELNLQVYAVHVNHNLRGAAARQDEGFARLFCESRGVPFFACQADAKGYAAKNKLGIEEAGRKLRYEFLRAKMQELGATKIAVGHNQDDMAETVLMNLFRGASLKGLGGIPPVNGEIIRPLIDVSRREIETYAAENRLDYVHDQSNFEVDYNRNYVRNEIMPLVRGRFGEAVVGTIARNARHMRADEDALTSTARQAFNEMAKVGSQSITLPIDHLLSHPTAIVSRVVRLSISHLRGMEDITSGHVESVIDIAQGSTGRRVSLPGITARREYGDLVIAGSQEDETADFCHELIPGIPVEICDSIVVLSIGCNLHAVGAGSSRPSLPQKHSHGHTCQQSAKDISSGREDPAPTTPTQYYTQAFNYDKVNQQLQLRTRRPGDKITLPGGTKKLQDYFTDTKTPKSIRNQIPLIADGENILWIMDKHNRTNTAYQPKEGQKSFIITTYNS